MTKTSVHVNMLVNSDTLSWFRANPLLLLLLNAVRLAEKQQIPTFIWYEPTLYHSLGKHAHSTTLGKHAHSTTLGKHAHPTTI